MPTPSKKFKLVPFKQLSHDDDLINRIQDNINSSLSPLQAFVTTLDSETFLIMSTSDDTKRFIVDVNSSDDLTVKETT